MSCSKFYKITHSEEIALCEDLKDIREYHEQCLKLCVLVEKEGLDSVSEQVKSSVLDIPKQPKIGLRSLLMKSPKQVNKPEKLHQCLKRLLVSDFDAEELNFPDVKNRDEVFNFLSAINQGIKKRQANNFCMSVAFGYYLNIYYEYHYKCLDDEMPWHVYIKEHFGVSESYGRKLRGIAKLVDKYPKLKYLSITIKDFLKMKTEISKMMLQNEYKHFWSYE